MELKPNMYVRTKRDGIAKIISLSIGEEEECCFIELSKRRTGIKEHNITKASYNIIDLIEENDILDYGFGGILCKSEVLKEDNKLGVGWNNDGDFISLESVDINSILTKEQFESMQYKVGE